MSRPSYQRKTSSDKQYGCIGEQFTEIFLKKFSNVQLVLDTLQEYDFKVRRPAIKFLTNLLVNKPRLMQQIVLQSEMGVSRQSHYIEVAQGGVSSTHCLYEFLDGKKTSHF
jgi:hypothetical protein